MPPDQGERLAKLETNMVYVLDVLSRREAYQNAVLESLTKITMKQDLFLEYQKECEAKREAHDVRIKKLEDVWRVLRGQAILIGMLSGLIVSAIDLWLRK